MNLPLLKFTLIHSLALRNYKDNNRPADMDDHQFLALCWTKATFDVLLPDVGLTFPNRIVDIPEED